MKTAVAALALLALLPAAANAQNRTVYERWTIYQDVVKPLPPGFHHFIPISHELSTRRFKEDMYVCHSMTSAISFGKRLGQSYDPEDIVKNLRKAWGGTRPCWHVTNVVLRPVEFAIRGDDQGRRIALVKWLDDQGSVYYTGIPRE